MIKGLVGAIEDPDCMERTFDASAEDFDAGEATKVLKKCKLLILRKAFDIEWLEKYKEKIADYHLGLHSGRYNQFGTTTNGEKEHLHTLSEGRWEVILPRKIAHRKIVANKKVMQILTNDHILGKDITLHSFGTALSEPGANAQYWHKDDAYLYSGDTIGEFGLGGNDLPAYAVTMMLPMLDLKLEHGPTEFCMGTSFLDGIIELGDDLPVLNKSLTNEGSAFRDYAMYDGQEACSPNFWRIARLNFGDLLLFDYQIRHRGGPNLSDDTRVVMYLTYSRSWFKDRNFLDEKVDEDEEFLFEGEEYDDSDDAINLDAMQDMVKPARYALPVQVKCPDNEEECWDTTKEVDRLEDIRSFMGQYEEYNEENWDPSPVRFFVTNKDVADRDVRIFKNGVAIGSCEVGQSVLVNAAPRDEMDLRSSTGIIYKTWQVVPGQAQIVVENPNFTQ
mmetsp:Transcript_27217/g.41785  ORF Transcript_27217/g.41785 Transcript_27217/m.41785 type:complete len:447 (+) Transcript_27217:76-1416(+)